MNDILNADTEDEEVQGISSERYEELKRAAAQGDEAARLIGSPLIEEYFKKCRAQMIEAMLDLDMKDDLGRYRLQVAINSLDNVKKFLHQSVQNGEFSAKQLQELSGGRKKRLFF